MSFALAPGVAPPLTSGRVSHIQINQIRMLLNKTSYKLLKHEKL